MTRSKGSRARPLTRAGLALLLVASGAVVACPLDRRTLPTLIDEDARGTAGRSRATSGAAGEEAGGGAGESGANSAAAPASATGGTHSHAGSGGRGGMGSSTSGRSGDGGGHAGDAGGGGAGSGAGGAGSGAAGAGTAGASAGSGAGGASGGISGGGAGGLAAGMGGFAGSDPTCPDVDQDGKPDCHQTLVTNAAFDTGVTGWSAETTAEQAWADSDAHQVTSSGSLLVTNAYSYASDAFVMSGSFQCLPAVEGHEYRAAAELFMAFGQPTQGNGALALIFYDTEGCTGATEDVITAQAGMMDVWQTIAVSRQAPIGSKSVLVRLGAVKPMLAAPLAVRFDNVLLREDQ